MPILKEISATFRIIANPVLITIRCNVDGAIQVSSQDFGSCGLIALNHFGVGVVHPVQVTAGENNRLRLDRLNKCR